MLAFIRLVSLIYANFALIVLVVAGIMLVASWLLSPIAATAYLLSLTGMSLVTSSLLSALVTVLAASVVVDYYDKR